MYLKKLECVGFKSFAEKTELVFEPGMTAIVGPNGCGKSNTSDAIRWVLGEQSAKALRGGNMADVIFTGTDSHKPLNMAEVSLTLADCEEALKTEYSEVTITRRVFRSGEGQYFINKKPVRLKDIQNLFMDTGIGRNSYSILEQGKIDQILSSRPDERRMVFEEASGITKYKADKKTTLRRLAETESNLIRLEDIIRENNRRIGSLQRQAGKARRYQAMKTELRGFDLYVTRKRLKEMEAEIFELEKQITSINEQVTAKRKEVETTENEASQAREDLANAEKAIAECMEESVRLRNEYQGAKQSIQVNHDRIKELEAYATRDSKDAEEAKTRLEEHRVSYQEQENRIATIMREREEAQGALKESVDKQKDLEQRASTLREELNGMRKQSIQLDDRNTQLHNELSEYDARERSAVIRKERLTAEKEESAKELNVATKKMGEMSAAIENAKVGVQKQKQFLDELVERKKNKSREINQLRQRINQLENEASAKRAKVELLTAPDAQNEAFPGGARFLLNKHESDNVDRSKVLGALAELFEVEPEFQTALEASLRTWLDAVVVEDVLVAQDFLRELVDREEGSARILTANIGEPYVSEETAGVALIDHLQYDQRVTNLVRYLLGSVRVLQTLDQLPEELDPYATYVTKSGAIIRNDGSVEYWKSNEQQGNPVAREQMLKQSQADLAKLEEEGKEKRKLLDALQGEESSTGKAEQEAREALNKARQGLASREGEFHVVSRSVKETEQRASRAEVQLNALLQQESGSGNQRAEISDEIEKIRTERANKRSRINEKEKQLEGLERERQTAGAAVTEKRIKFAELSQQVDHVSRQKDSMRERVKELEALIDERAKGITSYKERVEDLERQIEEAKGKIDPLEQALNEGNQKLEQHRSLRGERLKTVEEADTKLRESRATMDDMQTRKNKLEVTVAEHKVRHSNIIERLADEYQVSVEQLIEEPDPEWKDGKVPPMEELESKIAELKAKLDAMGPVNLIAIEEYQELEDQQQLLVHQQQDIIKAKHEMMEMIKKIDQTSTELFTKTFEQISENFQAMFKKIFGGGNAKLVLIDEDDVLETGIDIIAKPPGKQLQTVSLLSGGERTMTAVALLFSLYQVKPSPFCVLDELDAALDDANIGRFVAVVKEFVESSQFIVITHNQQTITAADVLYGVTMQQKGVSKVVSVKLTDTAEVEKAATGKKAKK